MDADLGRRAPVCAAIAVLLLSGCDCGARNPCDDVDCSGFGRCAALPYDLGAYCVCQPGFHPTGGGLECTTNDTSDPCEGVTCGGHGDCEVSPEGLPFCVCVPGWQADESGLWCLPDGTPGDGGSLDDGDALPDASGDGDADADGDAHDVPRPDIPPAVCGDGVRNLGEGCDDGNAINDDECRNDCSLPSCGDGVVSDVEECDDGPANSDTEPDACRTRCVHPVCGDGVVDTGERCDDGNRAGGDSCPASCFPDDAPPAEPIGEPVAADDGFNTGGAPVVDWNGDGWGVAWGSRGPLYFRALDADARPVGPLVTAPVEGGSAALAWGENSFAFASASWSHHEVSAGTLEALGALRSGPTWMPGVGENPGIAWSGALAGWILAYDRETDGGETLTQIVAARIDERSRVVEGPVRIGGGLNPVPVGLRSRVAIVWSGVGGIRYRGFVWPYVASGTETLALPSRVVRSGAVDAEAYDDFVLVAGMDGDSVLIGVVDALAGTTAGGPFALGGTGIEDRRPDLEAAPGRGFLGLCYETGPGPAGGSDDEDGIGFRVLRPDGTPVGAEVLVAARLRNAGGCGVGWSGTEFVVVYWSCGGDAEWNTIYAQRVRPLL